MRKPKKFTTRQRGREARLAQDLVASLSRCEPFCGKVLIEHNRNIYHSRPAISDPAECRKSSPIRRFAALRCIPETESRDRKYLLLIFFPLARPRARGTRTAGSRRGIPVIPRAGRPA